MSFAEDMPPDDVSQRTALAVEALHASQGVHMENVGIRRTLARMKGTWGTLAFFVVVIGVGYGLRDQVGHLATKDHVAEHDTRIEQLEKWKAAKDEHERAKDETMARMARQIDGLYEHLMREKH